VAFATHVLNYRGSWIESADGARKRIHTLVPSLKTEELRRGESFKASVLSELESEKCGEHAIMPFVREYLSRLSVVQGHIRDLYHHREVEWIGELQRATLEYCIADENSLGTGVVAIAVHENGRVKEEIHLLSDTEERLNSLKQTNRLLTNLHLCQVVT
jgi:hypothetical protein